MPEKTLKDDSDASDADHGNNSNDSDYRRIDLAEDRTLLANERTFAGWARTALAAVGIGVGFNALFDKMEPAWLPKAIATGFILAGLIVIVLAERNSNAVLDKLDAHAVKPVRRMTLRVVTTMVALGAVMLLAGIWLLV